MSKIWITHYDVLQVTVDKPSILTIEGKPRVSIYSRKRRDTIAALRKQVAKQADTISRLESELRDYEEDRF